MDKIAAMIRARLRRLPRRGRRKDFRDERPYALWTLRDGRQLLVDRRYRPFAERRPGGAAYAIEPRYVPDIAIERWFAFPPMAPTSVFGTAAARALAERIVREFHAGGDMERFLKPSPVAFGRPAFVRHPNSAPPPRPVRP